MRRCTFSQKSALLPNTRASIRAVSAVYCAAAVAQFVDVLARQAHGFSEAALRQAERLHELLDQYFANARRLALRHDHDPMYHELRKRGSSAIK
jgi:hypothetical protein